MALKFMYITNRPEVALAAEEAGVSRIFVDLEYIGKAARQGGMDTVQNHHTPEDIRRVRQALSTAELLVRVNPIHEASAGYSSSQQEIDESIEAGADILMLPYFKTAEEVRRFVEMTGGRARTMLLLETPEAAESVQEVLSVPGVDEMYIGLNDLSLGLGKRFMFEPLAEGLIDGLCEAIRAKGLPFGFGGIASPGKGALPAEYVIREHYRLGSSCVILSRSFCNADHFDNVNDLADAFASGVRAIRGVEEECLQKDDAFFAQNRRELQEIVRTIVNG